MAECMVAYCGLVCTECPAYRATKDEDRELLEKTAKRWSTPEHQIRPEDILCDGCKDSGKRMTTFCAMCPVRMCAQVRGVAHCGECEEYACGRLEQHWSRIKAKDEAKPMLEDWTRLDKENQRLSRLVGEARERGRVNIQELMARAALLKRLDKLTAPLED